MKWLMFVLAILCLCFTHSTQSIAQENLAKENVEKENKVDEGWMTFYYKSPSPERLVDQFRAIAASGALNDENAQPGVVSFLSQVMAQNPSEVPGWLKEFEDLDETKRTVLLAAAWYSDTEEAQTYFKEKELNRWLEHDSPNILEMTVDNPTTLDMLWGYFMATGDIQPIRRICTAFQLWKYSGAAEKFRDSEKTEQDKQEAWYDATFQAAQWSVKANCTEHPRVLEHCEAIFNDEETPKVESLNIGMILVQLKPDEYKIEIGDDK